jgi:hypothetical protein
MIATAGLVFWLSSRPVPPVTLTVTQDAPAATQDTSILDHERATCDRQVAALLTAKDPVELERAKFLINKLNCGIGRRLPPP